MIKTKKDLKEYMEADRKQLGVNRKYPRPFTDEIWRYEIYLRKYEYYLNTQKKILSIWYKIVLHKLGGKVRNRNCSKCLWKGIEYCTLWLYRN